MREFDRIDRVTELINKVWKINPDLRFIQLVYNLSNKYCSDMNEGSYEIYIKEELKNDIIAFKKENKIDLHHLEDDKFEGFLKYYLEELKEK